MDTMQVTSRLPLEKLWHLRDLFKTFLDKSKATLKEFQTLLGHLSFTYRILAASRAFCSYLPVTAGVCRPCHFIQVTREIKGDLQVW